MYCLRHGDSIVEHVQEGRCDLEHGTVLFDEAELLELGT